MTRTAAREIAVHLIFEMGFDQRRAEEVLEEALTPENFASLAQDEPLYQEFPDEKQLGYIKRLVAGVDQHRPELDDYISRYAIGWSFGRIPRVAVAAMRAAMYEVLYMPEVPNAAAIDAALELLKHYVEPEVVSFVNGILGSFSRTELPEETPQAKPRDGEQGDA